MHVAIICSHFTFCVTRIFEILRMKPFAFACSHDFSAILLLVFVFDQQYFGRAGSDFGREKEMQSWRLQIFGRKFS